MGLVGHANSIRLEAISGWAANPDRPGEPVRIEVLINGTSAGEAVCRTPHDAAIAAGHAGARRFLFRPAAHLVPGRNAVLLRFAGTGIAVPNGAAEIVLEPSSDIPARGSAKRLAVVDTHFPWRVSGFRYWESLEILRQRPDTVFFATARREDPFPAPVHPFHEFLRLAARGEFSDVYGVFLNLAASLAGRAVLPSGDLVPGADPSMDISRLMERTGLRLHATFYAGGGLEPSTAPEVIRDVGSRCATVFTNLPEVEALLPGARPCLLPVNVGFYEAPPRTPSTPIEVAFIHANAARKNFPYLASAFNRLDPSFHLHLVGNWERELHQLTNKNYTFYGEIDPEGVREVHRKSHVFVVCSSEDQFANDGWPTTSGADAMSSGCLLVAVNHRKDHRTLKPGEDYLEIDLADPDSLVTRLNWVRDHAPEALRIAARGSATVRRLHDHRAQVEAKLRAIFA